MNIALIRAAALEVKGICDPERRNAYDPERLAKLAAILADAVLVDHPPDDSNLVSLEDVLALDPGYEKWDLSDPYISVVVKVHGNGSTAVVAKRRARYDRWTKHKLRNALAAVRGGEA